eukprot:g5603.t1
MSKKRNWSSIKRSLYDVLNKKGKKFCLENDDKLANKYADGRLDETRKYFKTTLPKALVEIVNKYSFDDLKQCESEFDKFKNTLINIVNQDLINAESFPDQSVFLKLLESKTKRRKLLHKKKYEDVVKCMQCECSYATEKSNKNEFVLKNVCSLHSTMTSFSNSFRFVKKIKEFSPLCKGCEDKVCCSNKGCYCFVDNKTDLLSSVICQKVGTVGHNERTINGFNFKDSNRNKTCNDCLLRRKNYRQRKRKNQKITIQQKLVQPRLNLKSIYKENQTKLKHPTVMEAEGIVVLLKNRIEKYNSYRKCGTIEQFYREIFDESSRIFTMKRLKELMQYVLQALEEKSDKKVSRVHV